MQKFKTFLTVIGAVTILVLAANSAVYAATGGKFILGKTNKAGAVSTLKRTTSGPALNLVTKSSSNAPMTVNGRGKVANLNADLVDGKNATDLGVRTRVYRQALSLSNVSEFNVTMPSVSPGTYLIAYDAWLYATANSSSWCWVDLSDPLVHTSASSLNPVNASGFQPVNGSGIIRLTSTAGVRLHCEYAGSQSSVTNYSAAPMEIVLTKVDSSSGSALARMAGGSRVAPSK